jgi:hypothetical protein
MNVYGTLVTSCSAYLTSFSSNDLVVKLRCKSKIVRGTDGQRGREGEGGRKRDRQTDR